MKSSTCFKITLSSLLVAMALAGLIVPVWAVINDGGVVNISSLGAGSPDIEISSIGPFIAVAYYNQLNGDGPVYVKSSSASGGWVTSKLVGFGSDPQLAFSSVSTSTIYVVWKKSLGTAIQSARCTLSLTSSPTCTPGTDVQTASAGLNFPDVVVDDIGVIHVAWQKNINSTTTVIETRFSSNNLSSWSSVVTPAATNLNEKPVLAWSNPSGGRLHLAYLNGTSTGLTSVEYRRSLDTSHNWNNATPRTFAIAPKSPADIINIHNTLDNPTIAASGNDIYLAWDARRGTSSSDFSLIHATSIDNGSNWSNSTYAPVSNPATLNDAANQIKSSLIFALPAQEVGLRPSVAISSPSAAIVWQEIPGQVGCGAIIPFPHILLATPLTGAGSDNLENQGFDDSMIDPDLAVGSSGVHRVFMRDDNVTSCPPFSGGNGSGGYLITYRGPFTKTTNDQGEGGGTFLPVIIKN